MPTLPAAALEGGEFTYQGRLDFQGEPVSGSADFRFAVWDAAQGGQAMSEAVEVLEVEIADGLFTTIIDFADLDIWNTDHPRWLEIAARYPAGSGAYVVFDNRQRLSAAPFSLHTRGIHVGATGSVGIGTVAPDSPGSLAIRGTYDEGMYDGTAGVLLQHEQDSGLTTWTMSTSEGGHALRFSTDNANQFAGVVSIPKLRIRGGSDIAEPFAISDQTGVQPGMVVAIDSGRVGELRLATDPYDPTVAGIISGAGGVHTGMTLTQEGTIADGDHPVALTGRVWCWCDADANGPIQPGDMLTTSATPGHAMVATDRDRAFGSTIGKAMSSLESGQGLVLVLVNLQ